MANTYTPKKVKVWIQTDDNPVMEISGHVLSATVTINRPIPLYIGERRLHYYTVRLELYDDGWLQSPDNPLLIETAELSDGAAKQLTPGGEQ